jgi:hypothetical protein
MNIFRRFVAFYRTDGILKVNNTKWKMTHNEEEGIFCQLMTKEFKNERTWFHKKIKLDISVLRDLKFDIYRGVGSFDDGKTVPFKTGKGNYKRIPSMKKTIQMIKDIIEYNNNKDRYIYIYSHEIIIRQDIDLKKYMIN